MTRDPGAGEHGNAPEGDPLIFVSDASAEAERITAALRARGYRVADVPLGLLVNRVAVQQPALIVCDVDAPDALEVIARLREGPSGAGIAVLFIGAPERTLDEKAEQVHSDGSDTFYRPVDVDAVLRKIEVLVGPPRVRDDIRSSSPAHRSPVLVASTRKPYRYEGVARGQAPSQPAPSSTAAPESERSAPSGAHPLEVSHPPSLQGVLDGPAPKRVIPQSALSPELQKLLLDAEHRLVGTPGLSLPPPARMAPEEEVEAVLPAEVLAALDEPLDLQDDDDFGSQVGGTRSGNERRGSDVPTASAAGSADAGVALPPEAELASTTPPRRGESAETSPERAAPAEQAPITPRALRRDAQSSIPPSLAPEQLEAGFESVRPVRSPSGIPNPPSGPKTEMQSTPPMSAGTSSSTSAMLATTPPHAHRAPSEPPAAMPPPDIPTVLGPGDALRALARMVAARVSGALVVEEKPGMRRAVLRDGDFVTAVSGIEGESLVAFLAQRGDLTTDAVSRLGRTLPQFGRHAGAALVARGYLKQDDLWNVLRAHAEWALVRIARVHAGSASFEPTLPERLRSEPAVFGGATGAEVVLEVARRALPPEDALARLGGRGARLRPGSAPHLLGECALSDAETELIRDIDDPTVEEFLERTGGLEFAPTLLALVELGVLDAAPGAIPAARAPNRPDLDAIDDDAVRTRIEARKRLVDEADYFALLGVSRTATSYDVRKGYLSLRREFEPGRILTARTADLVDDVTTINEVLEEAYEILRDDVRRERYRRALGD